MGPTHTLLQWCNQSAPAMAGTDKSTDPTIVLH